MSISPWKRFGLLLKPDQKEIKNIYLFAVFSGLIYLSVPLGIQAITNLIQIGQINASWILLVIIVIGSVGFSGLLQIQQLKITELIQQKIFARAAFDLSYRIPRIKEEELKGAYAPELMNRFFDIVSVQKGVTKILIDFSAAIVQILFGMVVLAFYHPFYIIFSLILVFSILLFIRISFSKGLKSSLSESNYKYRTAHWLEEVARNKNSFKLLGNPALIMRRTNSEIESYVESRESHFRILLRQYGLLILFKVVLISGLLVIGGILVMEQQMNIGQFVAAEIIILLIMNSVEKIVLSIESVYDVLTSLEKIGQILDMKLESDQGYIIDSNSEEFDFRLSEFLPSYNIYNPINFTIRQGQSCVIQTSNELISKQVIQVIAGFDKGKSGKLIVNNIPFANLNVENFRMNVGFVLIEDALFDATLVENITLGNNKILGKSTQKLLDILDLNDFIHALPKGFETRVLIEENKLPDRIKNKILLARNILHHPRLLVIEDPSAYLTNEMILKVSQFIKENNMLTALLIIEDKKIYELPEAVVYHLNETGLTLKK